MPFVRLPCWRPPSKWTQKISGKRTLEGRIACRLLLPSTRLYFLAAITGTGVVLRSLASKTGAAVAHSRPCSRPIL